MQFNVSCFLAIAFRTQRSTIDAEVIRTTSPSAVAPVLSGSVLRFSSPVQFSGSVLRFVAPIQRLSI
jgi:hypothetical protein